LIAGFRRSILKGAGTMPVQKTPAEVAFLAAALALLGAPVMVLAGLIAFGLAARVLTPIDQLLRGPFVMALVFGWAVLVVTVVLILGIRMSRRMTRP
jgi:hypothetical protein